MIDIFESVLPYLKNFIEGLIISAAPIIAAIGIVINNKKASKRDVANQIREFKLNMLEKTYEKYNEFSRKDMLFRSNRDKYKREMIYELINYGTNTTLYKVISEGSELITELFIVGMYYQELREEMEIDISFDELVELEVEEYKKIFEDYKSTDFIMRYLIRNYSLFIKGKISKETILSNLGKVNKDELKKMNFELEEIIKEFGIMEKKKLLEMGYDLLTKYNKEISIHEVSEKSIKIEKQIASYISDILL